MLEAIDTKIVGVTFEGRQSVCAGLFSGARLSLVREPYNAYDPNAIAVLFENEKCGYISKSLASKLAPLMDGGTRLKATVRSLCGGGDLSIGVNITVQEVTPTDTPCEGVRKVSELEEIGPFVDHLEFMGYTITEIGNNGQKIYQCTHPIRMDFFIIPMEGLPLMVFRTHWVLEKDTVALKEMELLKRINELNSTNLFVCCSLTADNLLVIEADLLKQYEKISFGIFIEYFLETVKKTYTALVQVIEREADSTIFEEENYRSDTDWGHHDEYCGSAPPDEYPEEEYWEETDCSSCPHACGDAPEMCEGCQHRSMHPSGNWDDDREILPF